MTTRDATVIVVFDAQTLATGTTIWSDPIDMSFAVQEKYTLQYRIQEGGRVIFGYAISNDGVNYLATTDETNVLLTGTSVAGTGANGKDIKAITPVAAARMKIAAWEPSGSTGAGCTVTAYLCMK